VSKDLFVTARSQALHKSFWRRIASATLLLVSVGFLGYKTYTNWNLFKTYDWQIQYQYLIPSFLLFLVQLAVVACGWKSIMDCLTQSLPFWEHIKIYAYTNLLRRVPAGTIWMVAGRVYAYKGQRVPARASALGSFLEFMVVVLTALPLATLAAVGLELISTPVGIALAALAMTLELVAVHPALLSRLFKLIRHERLQARLGYSNTLQWVAIYNLVWLLSGTGLFIIVRLFIDIPLEKLPVTIGVWVLSSLVAYLAMFSPSGLGVKELSLTLLLGLYVPEPLPLLIALAIRLIWTVYDVVLGVVAWVTS
jgi:hypothetical protein